MSIAARFIRGSGLNLVDHVLKTVALLLTTPLVVESLGKDGYGYWLLAMSVLSYFAFLDLGVSFSTTRFLSSAAGAKDLRRQGLVCHLAGQHFDRVGKVILGGGVLALTILAALSNLPEGWTPLGVLAATLPGAVTMAFRFRNRLPQLLMRAWIRYDLLAAASIIRVLFQSTCLYVAISAGGGVMAVGLIHAAADLVELGMQRIFSRRVPSIPEVRDVGAEEMQSTQLEMRNYTRDILIGSIGDSVRSGGGVQATSVCAGIGAVASYSIGARLITILEDLVNTIFGGGTLSVLGHLHGANNQAAMTAAFKRMLNITAGFCAMATTGVVLFAGPFIELWLGAGFEESVLVVKILALPHALMLMQYPAHSLLYTLGLQRPLMWVRCGGGIAVCLLGFLFGWYWGMLGVVAASALEVTVCNGVVMSVLLSRALGISAWAYLLKWLLWPGVKGMMCPLAVGLLVSDWAGSGIGGFAGAVALYALTMIVSGPLLLMGAEDRALFGRFFRRSK